MSDNKGGQKETESGSSDSDRSTTSSESERVEPPQANTPSPPARDETKSHAGTAEPVTKNQASIAEQRFVDRINKSDLWMIRLTGALVALTVALVSVGAIQAWSFIASERAFLIPGGIRFGANGFAANKRMQVIVTVQNSGRTAAFVSKANVSVYIAEQLPPKPHYLDSGNQSGGAIAAGGARDFRLYEFDAPANVGSYMIDDYNFKAVNSGEATFYVFGFIEYTDDFRSLEKGALDFVLSTIPRTVLAQEISVTAKEFPDTYT